MKKEDIHLDDIKRILLGETPPLFMLEVLIRTLIIYISLLFVLRWLGKRMSGQLTIMELAVMLTLGAIVSASMQLPDRGILQGILLLLCVLGLQKGISYLGFFYRKFEYLTQGKASMLVKDGVIQLSTLQEERVTRQQLFAELRTGNVFNLGEVERMYIEAPGFYSTFKAKKPKPGLSVYPPDDHDIVNERAKANGPEKAGDDIFVCISCGYVRSDNALNKCADCGHDEWTLAVI